MTPVARDSKYMVYTRVMDCYTTGCWEYDTLQDLIGGNTGQYITIWEHTGPYITIQDRKGKYSTKWDHRGLYGTIGEYKGP